MFGRGSSFLVSLLSPVAPQPVAQRGGVRSGSLSLSFPQVFEYSEAKTGEELFYPTYDLSGFSWDSINRTLNHTALTAEFKGVPATDPSGSFSNGSLAFRVSPGCVLR